MNIQDYIKFPRPQFRRDDFFILDGDWKLNDSLVRVPFPPQSVLSDFEGEVPDEFTYTKEFEIPESFTKERIILHFGAVDQCCVVKINGNVVGEHKGGYTAFSFDITDMVNRKGNNIIEVQVEDGLSTDYSYGKQTRTPKGMWYTPVSGIWKSVWLENVPDNYIERIIITPQLDRVNIAISNLLEFNEVKIKIRFNNSELLCHRLEKDSEELIIPNPLNWTVDNPYLYEFVITADEDRVEGYFALRTITIKQIEGINRVCLNDRPIFMHGVLDQGYFKEGIYTPRDYNDYVKDIANMKELGFNMLRKHIKVEAEQFYYACDVLGMLVVQDMVNSGKYSFVRDTVLPTIGFNKRKTKYLPSNNIRRMAFEAHMREVTEQLYNHPCVVVYTIFNEGWGQFNTEEMYEYLKELDSTRLIDSASGWFLTDKSDFDSPHIYFRNVKLKPKTKPMFLSECGGYKYMIKEHYFGGKEYGYGSCKDMEELTKRIENMYETMVIPAISKGLCGSVYTQLSDVEGEINGLYTYDRKVCKVDEIKLKELAYKINNEIQ